MCKPKEKNESPVQYRFGWGPTEAEHLVLTGVSEVLSFLEMESYSGRVQVDLQVRRLQKDDGKCYYQGGGRWALGRAWNKIPVDHIQVDMLRLILLDGERKSTMTHSESTNPIEYLISGRSTEEAYRCGDAFTCHSVERVLELVELHHWTVVTIQARRSYTKLWDKVPRAVIPTALLRLILDCREEVPVQ